jgi:type VI secretion system protein ImpA
VGSPQTVDVAQLLAPISDSAPTGTNIRLSAAPLYFNLKDARNSARAAERRADAEADTTGVLPEWRTILELAPKVTIEQSKDLEVAAWLIEALVRTKGFAGLRDGFRITRGLVEQYWDRLYPLQDEDGIRSKVAPLTGLLDAGGTLAQPLRKVPLTNGSGDGPFAAYHYEQAVALGRLSDPEARTRREAAGIVTLKRFTAAAEASGGSYYVNLLADIEECVAELDALSSQLDARAGAEAPPVSSTRDTLETILDTVRRFSKDLVERAKPMAAKEASKSESTPKPVEVDRADIGAGPVRNREDALRILLQVAEYFRTYEPHSPISTSLEEIVRRARLPFAELLAELLPDNAAWRSALMSAGIKPPNAT